MLSVANIVRAAEPLIFDLWRSHGLTLAQLQCLRILGSQRQQAGDLAKKLSMSSTSLTRILERLESRQLVKRTVDTHDRRRIWVQLTPTGKQTVGGITSWYSSSLFWAIQQMSSEELEQFTTTLRRFTQAMRDCETEPSSNATSLSTELQ